MCVIYQVFFFKETSIKACVCKRHTPPPPLRPQSHIFVIYITCTWGGALTHLPLLKSGLVAWVMMLGGCYYTYKKWDRWGVEGWGILCWGGEEGAGVIGRGRGWWCGGGERVGVLGRV